MNSDYNLRVEQNRPAGKKAAFFFAAAFLAVGTVTATAQSVDIGGILESPMVISLDSLDFTTDEANAATARFLSSRNADTLSVSYDTLYYSRESVDYVSDDNCRLIPIDRRYGLPETAEAKLPKHYGIIRTNLIGDALLIPNVGGEIAVTRHWSLGADFYLQWIRDWDKDKFYETYQLDLNGRYWLNSLRPSSEKSPRAFSGWHIGPYFQAVTYDWENGNKGYQSRVFFWTFGAGCEAGYNLPVGKKKRWALDFYLGIGYFHTKQNIYYPGGDRHYYLDHRRCRNIVGPTRFGMSLNYIIK